MEKKLGALGGLVQKNKVTNYYSSALKQKKLTVIMKAIKKINNVKQPNRKRNSYTLNCFFLNFSYVFFNTLQ